jgi:hypothetical protein
MTATSVTSPHATRREVEGLLRGTVSQSLLDWAVYNTFKHGWTIESSPAGEFLAVRAKRTIYTPRLNTDGDAASFFHEGGHLQDRVERQRTQRHQEPDNRIVSIPAEAFAWLWAIKTLGHHWNPGMQHTLEECLEYYKSFNDSYGDLQMLEATIEHGRHKASRVVSLRTRPVPAPIAPLMKDLDDV